MSKNRMILGASVVAIAATSAWMTLGASSTMSNPTPAAQAQPAAQTAPAPAPAAQTATATPAAKPSAPAASTSAPMPVGTAAQQAHIDPKTGQLRQIEHDDVLKATPGAARRAARTAASEPQQFATEVAVGVAVPDEVLPYTVATVAPDGKVVIEHVQGGKAAADKVKANSSKKGLSHRKEEPNDR
jgi:hypothetical protein